MRAFEFIVESKELSEITGDCWVSPTNRIVPVNGDDMHIDVAGALMNVKTENDKLTSFHTLLKHGWIRIATTGYKNAFYLQAYSKREANKYFPNIIRKLPMNTKRVGLEWIEPDIDYQEYSLIEAERRFK